MATVNRALARVAYSAASFAFWVIVLTQRMQ
jgi:hypothetical protein